MDVPEKAFVGLGLGDAPAQWVTTRTVRDVVFETAHKVKVGYARAAIATEFGAFTFDGGDVHGVSPVGFVFASGHWGYPTLLVQRYELTQEFHGGGLGHEKRVHKHLDFPQEPHGDGDGKPYGLEENEELFGVHVI